MVNKSIILFLFLSACSLEFGESNGRMVIRRPPLFCMQTVDTSIYCFGTVEECTSKESKTNFVVTSCRAVYPK